MAHTAISNPYFMEQAPKVRTAIDISVNGRHAVCHRCGKVRVKVVKAFYLGRIDTGKKDQDGNKIYNPRAVDLCSKCNSVIQRPPAVPSRPRPVEGKVNPKIYALLAHLINGEREGWKLCKLLEVSPPTMWTYLWELQRNGLVRINKDGRNASLKMVDVTEEGLHHFDIATSKVRA